MSGIVWHILVYSAAGLFLIIMVYRIFSIRRQPAHLRWELAPVPHEKGKIKYGGSYLENFEWWQKPRRRTRIAPLVYMAGEIFLLKGVWKNNRPLWPLSFSLHAGIYLIIITVILHFVDAMLLITGTPLSILKVFQNIAAITALAGDVLGGIGAIGLILKRSLDANLRHFSTVNTYLRLAILEIVFISGSIAWVSANGSMSEVTVFVRDLITLNNGITASMPLGAHIIIGLLFLIYLPWTDMAHFITKYFTYHAVRWNDTPQDNKMAKELRSMAAQPLTWSANHINGDGKKSWADLTMGETGEKK